MARIRSFVLRVAALGRRRKLDRRAEEELRFHVEMQTEENVRRGMVPDEARRHAYLHSGGVEQSKELHRDARGFPSLDSLAQDLRFAFRLIAKNRRFSAAAVAAIALGIGVNAIGFTVVNVAFLKGLPVRDAGRLVTPCWQSRTGESCVFSWPELNELRAASEGRVSLAGFDSTVVNLGDDRAFPEQVNGVFVSAQLFSVIGIQPILGRDLVPDDDRVDASPVALIGYDLWNNRFGADSEVLGKTVRVNGTPATIVGVMPEGMAFPDSHQMWMPWLPFNAEAAQRPDARSLDVVGRLGNGTSRPAAAAVLDAAIRRLAAADTDLYTDGVLAVSLKPFTEQYVGGQARVMFTMVMGAVSFVLLIACANVANLLLSRSGDRAHELSVRASLGASRYRVVRQLLIESVVLASLGGVLGLLLAGYGVAWLESAMTDSGKPYWLVFTLDSTVAAYVVAISVTTAVLFGLAPALQASKAAVGRTLQEGGRVFGSRRAGRLASMLVVLQVSLSLVLLGGAGLMIRSFHNLYTLDLGFAADRLVVFGMDLFGSYADDAMIEFVQQLELRASAIPGVQDAAVTTGVPPRDRRERRVEIDKPDAEPARFVSFVAITPRFFETVDVALLAGRNFEEADGQPGAEAVLVNERFAQDFFPGENPIGKRLRFVAPPTLSASADRPAESWRTIVGVTPTIRQGAIQDGYLNSVVYAPYRQEPDGGAYLLVRTSSSLAEVSDAIRSEVQSMDPDQPLRPGETLDQWMARDRWPYRVFGTLFAALAAIALTLSSIGIYAVMARAVTNRTQEIGVRMAVGAQERQIVWLVLRRGLVQLGVGLSLGLAGAAVSSLLMVDLLVGIRPGDPTTLAAIAILLSGVSILACLIPARHAARIDPQAALRPE